MSFLKTLIGGGVGFLMGGPMGAAIGAGLGSGLDTAEAAGQAAETQAAAANRAADLQYQQWKEATALQEPWRQSGIAAQNQLLTLLGIAPQSAALSTGGGGGGGIFGGIAGAVANQIAQSGVAGPQLRVDTTSPEFGKYAKEFGMSQFQADPGYAFRLAEGQKALERSAAARGGLLGGATGKALQRYGQEMGSQEYQNAFNRYQAERAARLAPLQSLAGVGQTTAQQIGQAGQTMASNVGQAGAAAAQARASGYMGQANALNQALGGAGNLYMQSQILNRLMPSNVGANPMYAG